MSLSPVSVFWFRRDLRIDDNHGLYHCLQSAGSKVIPVFIFDELILSQLARDDHRVSFIFSAVQKLKSEFESCGFDLQVHHGRPLAVFKKLVAQHKISAVFTNEDYEPYARERDASVAKFLEKSGVAFRSFKDQVIFAKDEVAKDDGSPYRMFTPYSRKWLQQFKGVASYPSRKLLKEGGLKKFSRMPCLKELGFETSKIEIPKTHLAPTFIEKYAQARDTPGITGTTHIGPHLRFGTISPRHAVALGRKHSATWVKELIWREFFQSILFHYPQTVTESFDERFRKFEWRSLEKKSAKNDFEAWKEGRTGYPLVDAGMRELKKTGFMHNRVRMIVGSFLCKHLLLDWKLGERHFANMLFDFELASNIGNWQWVAGTGCDAAPYFRIFNPTLQTKKFDPKHEYIKKWVPELGTKDYPDPVVDHEYARKRALGSYYKMRGLKK